MLCFTLYIVIKIKQKISKNLIKNWAKLTKVYKIIKKYFIKTEKIKLKMKYLFIFFENYTKLSKKFTMPCMITQRKN